MKLFGRTPQAKPESQAGVQPSRRPYPSEAPDTALLPHDPATGAPRPPMRTPGYYPGYDIMSQKKYWDAATRNLVVRRIEQPPPIRYFTEEQARFWRAVFDHLLPQHDRTPDRRIPMVEPLDERLYRNQGVGYRYENMPPDREAYRLGQDAINQEARERFGGEFLDLPQRQQDLVMQAIGDSKPVAAKAIWKKMAVGRFWQLLLQDALDGYYSHPWSWDEIGYGGPAYPRAYTRLERGEPEPWEVEEQRYEWLAPAYAVSDKTEPVPHLHTESGQQK